MSLSFISLAVTELTLYYANAELLSPWQHPVLASNTRWLTRWISSKHQ